MAIGGAGTGIVFDTMRFAIRDGPGIRTTVFLKGCPLRCLWCHNPESQRREPELMIRPDRCIGCGECVHVCPTGAAVAGRSGTAPPAAAGAAPGGTVRPPAPCRSCGECARVCPSGAREMAGRPATVAEVVSAVERDLPFYDESGGGVTISGGEPLAQPEFLASLLPRLCERGLHTCLDTSGFGPARLLETVAPHVDTFLYDLKVMDSAAHERFTGVPNGLILDNLRLLSDLTGQAQGTPFAGRGSRLIVRIPVIPGVNDGEENLDAVGRFLRDLPAVPPVSLLPYHEAGVAKYARLGRGYPMPPTTPPSDARMEDIASRLRNYGVQVTLGR